MSSIMPAKHLIVLKRIMLLPRRNSWRWCLLVISLGSILLILKLLFILTMLPLSILCRKRMTNHDSFDGYSFFKNLICRLSIEKEKTIRWRTIFQGWKIFRMILFQSTTVFQTNNLLLLKYNHIPTLGLRIMLILSLQSFCLQVLHFSRGRNSSRICGITFGMTHILIKKVRTGS